MTRQYQSHEHIEGGRSQYASRTGITQGRSYSQGSRLSQSIGGSSSNSRLGSSNVRRTGSSLRQTELGAMSSTKRTGTRYGSSSAYGGQGRIQSNEYINELNNWQSEGAGQFQVGSERYNSAATTNKGRNHKKVRDGKSFLASMLIGVVMFFVCFMMGIIIGPNLPI